jgi:hypothetical protein
VEGASTAQPPRAGHRAGIDVTLSAPATAVQAAPPGELAREHGTLPALVASHPVQSSNASTLVRLNAIHFLVLTA